VRDEAAHQVLGHLQVARLVAEGLGQLNADEAQVCGRLRQHAQKGCDIHTAGAH
jgi:hypothetical protein